MRKIISLVAILFAANISAQPSNSISSKAKNADVVELVNIDDMPLPLPPGEAEKMRKSSFAVAADGFSLQEKSPEMVKGFFAHMNAANAYLARQEQTNGRQNKDELGMPKVYKDLSKLKTRFKPKSLSRGTLMAAAPSGTKLDDEWTGIDRFFKIDGAGSVRLSELDLGATEGKFYMMKEAVNTRIHGRPAISRIFTDDDGQTIEEVVWVEDSKFYMLTFAPELKPGTKTKASMHITAHSLAQELF